MTKNVKNGGNNKGDSGTASANGGVNGTMTTTTKTAAAVLVTDIGENDVLLGRGGRTNLHVGNKRYRALVAEHTAEYLVAKKKQKAEIARRIVSTVRDVRGGRFLVKAERQQAEQGDASASSPSSAAAAEAEERWVEAPVERAVSKTSQALRENLNVRAKAYRGTRRERRLGTVVNVETPTRNTTTTATTTTNQVVPLPTLPTGTKTTKAGTSSSSSGGNKKACVPCSGMDPSHLLPKADIEAKLAARLPLWRLVADCSDPDRVAPAYRVSRRFACRNFQCAMDCLNAVGAVAERESHHPDLHLTSYREVEIAIWTHKLGGVTEADLALAELIDAEVKIGYSPKWLKEHPAAAKTAAAGAAASLG